MPLYSGKNVQKNLYSSLEAKIEIFFEKIAIFWILTHCYEALKGNVEIHFWVGLGFSDYDV